MSEGEGATYARSGVSLEKADSFLGTLLQWVRRTEEFPEHGCRPLIPNGYYATVLDVGLDVALAFTTDGVGSKILVAEMARDFSGIGIDCIAMNVNDLLCVGARPIAMVDYLAIQDPPLETAEQLGRSLYEGARQAGISIPGGELAQLPEMIRGVRDGEGLDLAGAAIGLVARDEIRHGQGLAPGDVLVGIASSGIHSNGFSLARDVLFHRAKLAVSAALPELGGRTLGEELLRPTAIYVRAFRELRARGLSPKAALHITGGGFLNLLRVATDGVRFVLDKLPDVPAVFRLVQALGKVSDAEMHRVFNMGVGMVLVVDAARVPATLEALGEPAFVLGHLEAGPGRSVTLPSRGLTSRGDHFVPG